MSISIRVGTIEEALSVEQRIPEFTEISTVEECKERIDNKPHLLLIARDNDIPIGYLIGYEAENGIFYSWLGGVSPGYRRMGIAQQLLEMQEIWAQHHGYEQIRAKSRNKYAGMLILLIKNGYQIVDLEQGDSVEQTKVVFQKSL